VEVIIQLAIGSCSCHDQKRQVASRAELNESFINPLTARQQTPTLRYEVTECRCRRYCSDGSDTYLRSGRTIHLGLRSQGREELKDPTQQQIISRKRSCTKKEREGKGERMCSYESDMRRQLLNSQCLGNAGRRRRTRK
jgi:hypothetical protein